MTTIAYNYDEQKIACDGRVTSGDLICTDECSKYIVESDFIMFYAGSVPDVPRMIEIIKCNNTGDIADIESLVEVEALVIRDGKVYYTGVTADCEYFYNEITYNHAIGSGSNFAISAMDFGKSAKDAVKHAMTRDIYSGGKISVCDVKTRKIK